MEGWFRVGKVLDLAFSTTSIEQFADGMDIACVRRRFSACAQRRGGSIRGLPIYTEACVALTCSAQLFTALVPFRNGSTVGVRLGAVKMS